ncbi:hypothetical protein [Hahella ganghwensis]|uniref:hypothetical protein n=1 Tax=Hahella ganghwensis TaxID=286420 RepID=UPI000371AAB9|nr:hypothetical protein [Hahella ganghwensis]
MDEEIKKIVLRLFPELTGNYHLPRFAKVVAISDHLNQPELCDDFRPRYAVDIEMLTPQGEPDPELPVYRSVPLPVQFAGIERGQYGFPEPGALVEVGFAYGLPDHPFIRTVLGHWQGIPGIKPGDMVWQQSETSRQKVTAKGDWLRETHGNISDTSSTRKVNVLDNQEHYQNTSMEVLEHCPAMVAGTKKVEALGALKLLSGGHANLSAVDNLNLTTASDLNQAVGCNRNASITGNDNKSIKGHQSTSLTGNRTLTIQGTDSQASGQRSVNVTGNHTDIATAVRTIQAQVIQLKGNASVMIQAPSIALQGASIALGAGGSGTDVLRVLSDLCDVVSRIANASASHTHPSHGTAPSTTGLHVSQAGEASKLNISLSGLMP